VASSGVMAYDVTRGGADFLGRRCHRPHRTRSARYPAAADIDPAWTVEVVHDPDRLVDEPDPRSAHINSVRIVGYSPTARMVITVVALRDPYGGLHGASAWQSTGAALRQYLEDRSDD